MGCFTYYCGSWLQTSTHLQDGLSKVQIWSGHDPPKNSSKAPQAAASPSCSVSFLLLQSPSQHIHTILALKAKQIQLQLVPQIRYAEPDLCVRMLLLLLSHLFYSKLPLIEKWSRAPKLSQGSSFMHSPLTSLASGASLLNHLTQRFRPFLLFVAPDKSWAPEHAFFFIPISCSARQRERSINIFGNNELYMR